MHKHLMKENEVNFDKIFGQKLGKSFFVLFSFFTLRQIERRIIIELVLLLSK